MSMNNGSAEFPQSNFHEATLTAEQAQEINDNFNIVVAGGWHCQAKSRGTITPSELNYEATGLLTATLDPTKGDALFIEGVGYHGISDAQLGAMMDPQWFKTQADLLRDMQDIDSFNYVAAIATCRGVRVEYADVHHDTYQDFLATEGVTAETILTSDQAQARDQLRNEQAAYTVKDDALAHLQEVKASGEKRTYLHLMGDGHVSMNLSGAQLLPEIYKDMGLNVNVLHVAHAVAAIKATEAIGALTQYFLDSTESK